MILTPLVWISSVLLWTCRVIMRGILRTLAVNLLTSRVGERGRKSNYCREQISFEPSFSRKMSAAFHNHTLLLLYSPPLIHETRGHRQSTIELFLYYHLSNFTYLPITPFSAANPSNKTKAKCSVYALKYALNPIFSRWGVLLCASTGYVVVVVARTLRAMMFMPSPCVYIVALFCLF